MVTACTSVYRLEQAVNTLTTERALLALVALWNQLPFSTDTWSWKSVIHSLFGSSTAKQDTAAGNKEQVEDFYELLNDRLQQRLHLGVFEGCSLSGVVVRAEKGYDWHSLPAEAGVHWLQFDLQALKWHLVHLHPILPDMHH